MSKDAGKRTWNGTFTMAVGGLVGGGVFSVLGVVIGLAGAWAWLSLLLRVWSRCSLPRRTSGCPPPGAAAAALCGYLRERNHVGAAGTLAWALLVGYVLTMAVYAFTFGQYLANVLGLASGGWARGFGVAVVAVFGKVIVTVAAVLSTGSAINATLFAAARLAHDVAADGQLPGWVGRLNRAGVPDRAVLALGGGAAALAAIGGLATWWRRPVPRWSLSRCSCGHASPVPDGPAADTLHG